MIHRHGPIPVSAVCGIRCMSTNDDRPTRSSFVLRLRLTHALSLVLAILLASAALSHNQALAATPEQPVVSAATAVTGTTATLHGEINPGSSIEAVNYLFFYGPGVAACGGGVLRAPESFGFAEGSHVAVSAPLTNLVGNTEYTFCLDVFNAEFAESVSVSQQFTTPPIAPVIVSEGSSGITPFDAALEAVISPENQAATYRFEYGTDAELNGATTVGAASIPAGTEDRTVGPIDLGGALKPATVYFFRVVTHNATGETIGPIEQFTTLTAEPPAVLAEGATGVSASGVTLEATINPNFQHTTCHFQYVKESGLGGFLETEYAAATETPCVPEDLGHGTVGMSASTILAGLAAGTTYHYRVAVVNATGSSFGPDQTFTTITTPTATLGDARNIFRRAATLTGVVNPSGASTTYHFVYIDQAGYEAGLIESPANPYSQARSTSELAAGSGYAPQTVGPVFLNELRPGVTYHYALIASNTVGTVRSNDRSFITAPPMPPLAVTGGVVDVTPYAVTLVGQVDTRGLVTKIQFELGTGSGHGTVENASLRPGSEVGTWAEYESRLPTGLQPGTTYYYRVLASNEDGSVGGAERAFTTTPVPEAADVMPLAPTVTFPWYAFPGPLVTVRPTARHLRHHRGGRHIRHRRRGRRARREGG
jgi:hypothetical protein